MSARVILTGELGPLSLFDLAQLFLLSGTSGTLHVHSSGRNGFFRFERGQIWNAVDERLAEGEEAAYRLFAWRAGTFEFRIEQPTGDRTIHDSTDGLMLEAARRLDEAGVTESGESVTATLQARAGRFEKLREAFHRIALAARAGVGSGAEGSRFSALRSEGDALLYRPGAPFRSRSTAAGGRRRQSRSNRPRSSSCAPRSSKGPASRVRTALVAPPCTRTAGSWWSRTSSRRTSA